MAAENEEPEIPEEPSQTPRRKGYLYVTIPESMANQIYRNGIIPAKKNMDGTNSNMTRVSGEVHGDPRTKTSDGSLIIHKHDLDPHPNNCDTFIHPPYGSNQQYCGEYNVEYTVRVPLSKIAAGALKCGFCFILYHGIYSQRDLWISKWAMCQWIDSHPVYDPAGTEEKEPWMEEFQDEIELDKEIDEDGLGLDITFPKKQEQKCLTVCLVFWGQQEGALDDHQNQPRRNWDTHKPPNFRDPTRTLRELEYYTRPGFPSPWAAFVAAPHIHRYIFNNNCLKKISGWITECVFDHPACVENAWKTNSEAGDGLPQRLLRLRDCKEDPPHVWLEEITDPEEVYRYVALSHVWAYTEPCQSIRANYTDHKARVPWEHLSTALQGSVAFALALEYEYIWIDSLCIIQDDLADKEKEMPRMSLIYGQADVVFAVHGPDLGFHKVDLMAIEDPNRTDDAVVYCRLKVDHSIMFSTPRDPSSWYGRAWCMQESIFAPRILHFGGSEEEILFECNTLTRCECGALDEDEEEDDKNYRDDSSESGGQDQDEEDEESGEEQSDGSLNETNDTAEQQLQEELADRRLRKLTLKEEITMALASIEEDTCSTEYCNKLWQVYIRACENYTPRGVSISTDTLSAVSSLMHRFTPHLGKYHAGLWEHNLLISLQWEASMTGLCKRHEDYVAPSFSWASRSGGVIWYLQSDKLPTPETHEFATIIDISCELAGNDLCGRVSSGYMTLRGYTTEMKIENKSLWLPDDRLEMTKKGVESCFVTLDSREDLERVQVGTAVKCLDIMRDKVGYSHMGDFVSGLILLPVESNNAHFCRIGFSTMTLEHFKDAVLENVKIL